MKKPIITAHSGCEGTEIDSMESIDMALEYGADAVEVDVRVDNAGELRISHNHVKQEEYQTKLTLDDVMKKIRETDLSINCDLKEQAALYPTLEKAEELGISRERLILSGCTGTEQLIRDETLVRRGRFFLNIEEILKIIYLRKKTDITMEQYRLLMNDPWKVLKETGFQFSEAYAEETVRFYQMLETSAANLPKWLLGSPIVTSLQAGSVPLSIWTVNEPELVTHCLEAGVCNITTRKVRQALTMRESYFEKQ